MPKDRGFLECHSKAAPAPPCRPPGAVLERPVRVALAAARECDKTHRREDFRRNFALWHAGRHHRSVDAGGRHVEMAVHQGPARSRQRLLCLAAARRQLGLQQCRPDRRWRPDPAGRYAVRPQADRRDAGADARRGAGGQVDRSPGQHPCQRRPHLRQPARRRRRDHRFARLRRGDEGAAGRGAGGHAAQLAPARRGRRLPA